MEAALDLGAPWPGGRAGTQDRGGEPRPERARAWGAREGSVWRQGSIRGGEIAGLCPEEAQPEPKGRRWRGDQRAQLHHQGQSSSVAGGWPTGSARSVKLKPNRTCQPRSFRCKLTRFTEVEN